MKNTSVHEVTLTLDTSAYTSGDVLADTQEIQLVFGRDGGVAIIDSVTVLDKDDQGAAFDIVFLNANNSLGTENAAVSITDANAEAIVGIVSVAAADFADMINSKIATKTDLNVVCRAASGSRNLYVGAVARGTPTHSATGLVLKIGMRSE